MVLKSLSRKSGTRQILNYLFKENDKLFTTKQKPNKQKAIIVRHNVRSRTLDKWVKEFDKNESYRLHRRKDNVKVYHTILSFSNKDKDHIDEKVLRDTAKQYMRLRGENNLFIGTAHYDKDHIHLHLVMPGTKYLTGEANRLSRAEFHQLKLDLDTWQRKKYPNLINSLPRHGRSKEKQPELDLRSIRRGTQKESLLKTLEKSYSKSKSLDDFLSKLRTQGHEPYYRSGKLTGVKYEGGLKFRLNKLGYGKNKIAELGARFKEEKELSELRDLRGGRPRSLEQNNDRESKSSDKDVEDDKNLQNQEDDSEKGNQQENDDEIETDDDSDDIPE